MTDENIYSSKDDFSFADSDLEGLRELEGDALKEKLQGLFGEKAKKTLDVNRQLYVRAKKAEGFEENEKGEWVKVHKPESKSKAKETEKSDELGYGELAFLTAKGVKDEDFDFTKDEFKKFKSTNPEGKVEELLANPYFKSSLDARVAERTERDSIPEGGRSGQGGNDSFDVQLKKYRETGKMPQGPENAELRYKLSQARRKAEETHFTGPTTPIVGDYTPR